MPRMEEHCASSVGPKEPSPKRALTQHIRLGTATGSSSQRAAKWLNLGGGGRGIEMSIDFFDL